MNLNKALLVLLALFHLSLSADGELRLPLQQPTPSDELQFGKLWRHVQHLQEQDLLIPMIQKRCEEIAEIKDYWKKKIEPFENQNFLLEVETLLAAGTLMRAVSGSGGAYILSLPDDEPAFVLKPFDEDMLCLHNSKAFASPYRDTIFRVRRCIPLYRSMQAEALAYSFAEELNFTHLTPETHLGVFTHSSFFDISDRTNGEWDELGPPIREKLCSVQRYTPHLGNLNSLVNQWIQNGALESQICEVINDEEFENLFLLIWLLYDTDAHAGNIYVT